MTAGERVFTAWAGSSKIPDAAIPTWEGLYPAERARWELVAAAADAPAQSPDHACVTAADGDCVAPGPCMHTPSEVVVVPLNAVWRLILAADTYGVRYLDSDDMSDEALELQYATEAVKTMLASRPAQPPIPTVSGEDVARVFKWLSREPMVAVTSLDGEVKEPLVCLTVPEANTARAILSLLPGAGSVGWRPISEHDGSGAPVDLWRDGERLTDFRWKTGEGMSGRWEKKHGYPTSTTVLMTAPSHFMPAPAAPTSVGDGGSLPPAAPSSVPSGDVDGGAGHV